MTNLQNHFRCQKQGKSGHLETPIYSTSLEKAFSTKEKKIFDALKKSKTTSKPQKYFRIIQKNLDLKKHFQG